MEKELLVSCGVYRNLYLCQRGSGWLLLDGVHTQYFSTELSGGHRAERSHTAKP